jgi:hypothetical protein
MQFVPQKAKRCNKSKNAPATAAGQALGYSLQFTRLAAMLLDAPDGSSCSLELLDDVAEQSPDGKIKLGQSKSALTGNPVADRAVSLWKTLFNWLQLVEAGLVDPTKTIFELYVSRQVNGEIIEAFHNSGSMTEAQAAVSKARDELWGISPTYTRRVSLADGLSRYVNPVFEADEKHLIPIILNLHLKCGSGSPQADIEAAIRRDPVSSARVFDIADKLCGWVKRQLDKQLEKGLPAVILRDDFHREYVSYVRSIDRDIILRSLAKSPSDAEKLERLPDTFVQQLDLISLPYDEKLEAISDFLRACWDRAKWSEAGDVHESSFIELDENLNRTWRNHSRSTTVEAAGKPESERGQLLHARCMNHQAKVQGMEPPVHFVPGCFHRLADDLIIGWHPAYKALVGKPVAKAS